MKRNVVITLEQATASLNTRQTEAEASTLSLDALKVERDVLYEERRALDARESAHAEKERTAYEAVCEANRAEVAAKNIVGYLTANALAGGQVTRNELIDSIDDEVRPSLPYANANGSYGAAIVYRLEAMQGADGLCVAGLAYVAADVVRSNGKTTPRKLTKAQLRRVEMVLATHCPVRHTDEEGNRFYGTPYVLEFDTEGNVL